MDNTGLPVSARALVVQRHSTACVGLLAKPAAGARETSDPVAALCSRKDGTCESSAVPPSFILACFSFHAPLLNLFAARNTVGAREVGGAQVKKDGKVGRGVAGPESEISVVEFCSSHEHQHAIHMGAWA